MKATVNIVCEVAFEISDNGYLGITGSIEDHIKRAKDNVQRHSIYLKGPGDPEPKQVHGVMKVVNVVIEP